MTRMTKCACFIFPLFKDTNGVKTMETYTELVSECINSLQCYQLTRRCSPLPLMLASPLTYAVHLDLYIVNMQ